ncbi:MAG: DUF3300 domain-containing protein [Acidobacteriia bacterium]|nr:DUF3300 domain-containing protein [Terriglobia bacterium]
MRKTLAILLVICFCITGFDPLLLPGPNPGASLLAATEQAEDTSYAVQFTPEQLDNLVAPIALYPDPLLAQVLLASTFVDQISDAAQWVGSNNDPNYIDSQPWDVSVKAVAHYPSVLYMMRDRIDWTTSLGQAYVDQSTDVMLAVQRLRRMARSAGNLVTTPQQQVIYEGGYVQIVPAQPRYIYVPVYDPGVVYYRRAPGAIVAVGLISFGAGLLIGAWLNHDCDWRGHRVFYHGWVGGGWIGRSRTNVHITNIYVNNNYRNVHINRTVVNRNVDYKNLNRYNGVHRNVDYSHVNRHAGGPPSRTHGNAPPPRVESNRGREPMTHRTPTTQSRPQTQVHKETRPQVQEHKQVRPQVQEHKQVKPQVQEHKQIRPKTEQRKVTPVPKQSHKQEAPKTQEHKKGESKSEKRNQ